VLAEVVTVVVAVAAAKMVRVVSRKKAMIRENIFAGVGAL